MRHKLKALNYNFNQFSLETFVAHLETLRGRKIIFVSWPMPSGLFGAWVSLADRPHDYIFYSQNIPTLLQIHSQLHELAHVICQHPTLVIGFANLRELIQQSTLESLFTSLPLRSATSNEREVEAEALAILIQETVMEHKRFDQIVMSSTHVDTMKYIESIGFSEI